ncbi:nucleotidyl transferase AbiEii/AbiGii toxin family protein [Patescibacteria group bacterium]
MATLIDQLKTIKDKSKLDEIDTETVRVILKEKLQLFILNFLYNHQKYKDLVFYGGSALRIVHDLNRLSEDLDFEKPKELDISNLTKDISDYFTKEIQYKDIIISKQGNTIKRITLKFPVLYELDLSTHESENLHLKIEVNTKPTGVYKTELTPVTSSSFSFLLKTYDLPTLMAGKMIAVLERNFRKGNTEILIKGRDFYDLIWYMSKNIKPNEKKLLDVNRKYTTRKTFQLISKRIENIKSRDLLVDLEFLFKNHKFIKNWCKSFHNLYEKYIGEYLN